MSNSGSGRIFYGWWIVAATLVILFVGCGIAFYSFSVFMKPLEAQFGWSRTTISLGVAIWALMYGLSGPLVGVFIQKFGARAVIAGSALIGGICYMLLGSLNHLPMLYVLLFFAGIGTAGFTLVPNQTLVSNWFDKYRGRAMGIMMTGIGFGGLIMPPLANALITEFDWRTSFRVLGILLIFAIIPLAVLVVRTRPSDKGLEPDGVRHSLDEEGAKENETVGLSVKRAVRTASFWMLFVVFMLQTFSLSGLTVHFVACVDDTGVSSQTAANVWGLAIGFSVLGRLFFGFLADRTNPKTLLAIANNCLGIAVAGLLIFFLQMRSNPSGSLLAFSLIYGFSLGGSAVLFPVITARCFGLLNFSKIIGLLMSGFAFGVISGPLMAGHLFDTRGDYRLAMLLFAIAFSASGLVVLLVQSDRYKGEFSSE